MTQTTHTGTPAAVAEGSSMAATDGYVMVPTGALRGLLSDMKTISEKTIPKGVPTSEFALQACSEFITAYPRFIPIGRDSSDVSASDAMTVEPLPQQDAGPEKAPGSYLWVVAVSLVRTLNNGLIRCSARAYILHAKNEAEARSSAMKKATSQHPGHQVHVDSASIVSPSDVDDAGSALLQKISELENEVDQWKSYSANVDSMLLTAQNQLASKQDQALATHTFPTGAIAL